MTDKYLVSHPVHGRDDAVSPIHRAPFKSFGVCPNCGSSISTRNASNYCHVCGQRIDWALDS